MHNAGVCRVLSETIMMNAVDNIVNDAQNMYGRPTNYILEHPEQIIFLDETGSNTCQLNDGHVGGELFILPKDGSGRGRLGSTTDLHFTVLPFIAGTGELVMCAII
jgi:hypothetical protein